ncbi:carboxymuconolactone decarboxylase family protein [Micromonospora sp. NPDC048935]|uniref:carboxymuconolactone decarboxylase family protein n=1 Tax=Micromonospora sp. NPDC048935 TaxID=3364262 RepID=UPI00371FE913
MAHIDLGLDEREYPGITGPLKFRPETAAHLNALAEALLHAPHPTFPAGERELIAAYVSGLNECTFCHTSHAAFAAEQINGGMSLVSAACADPDDAPLSDRMRALLVIAASVQRGGRQVTLAQADAARASGATDLEIHDTVLIAAAFCMFNRYVDGLGTVLPDDPSVYAHRARTIAAQGYL